MSLGISSYLRVYHSVGTSVIGLFVYTESNISPRVILIALLDFDDTHCSETDVLQESHMSYHILPRTASSWPALFTSTTQA